MTGRREKHFCKNQTPQPLSWISQRIRKLVWYGVFIRRFKHKCRVLCSKCGYLRHSIPARSPVPDKTMSPSIKADNLNLLAKRAMFFFSSAIESIGEERKDSTTTFERKTYSSNAQQAKAKRRVLDTRAARICLKMVPESPGDARKFQNRPTREFQKSSNTTCNHQSWLRTANAHLYSKTPTTSLQCVKVLFQCL